MQKHRVEEVSQFDGRVEDESQFDNNHEDDYQIATPEVFVPCDLSAEERDAPGDGTDDPAPDIVVSSEVGGASGITSLGSDAHGDGSDDEPFIDDEPAPEIIQPTEGGRGPSTQLCVEVDACLEIIRGVRVVSRPPNPDAKC